MDKGEDRLRSSADICGKCEGDDLDRFACPDPATCPAASFGTHEHVECLDCGGQGVVAVVDGPPIVTPASRARGAELPEDDPRCPKCERDAGLLQRWCPTPASCQVTAQVGEHVHRLCKTCGHAWTRAVYDGSIPEFDDLCMRCEEGGLYVVPCGEGCPFGAQPAAHEHVRCDRCRAEKVVSRDASLAPAGMTFEFTSPKESKSQTGRKVGRNDPCPCGSGKKFKKCCVNLAR